MGKKTKNQINTEIACTSLSNISKMIFPRVKKDVFDIYEYTDGCLFHYIKWNKTFVCQYVNDNYEKGLKRIIKALEDDVFSKEEQILAKHLLVALASVCLGRRSDTEQDKKTIVYNLFVKSHTFNEAVKLYAEYTSELLAVVFFNAFRMLEQQTMEKIIDEYISQYSKRSDAYIGFIGELHFKFINCFINLPYLSEKTCPKYCELSEYVDLSLPKMKFNEHQCYSFLHNAKQGVEGLKALKPLQRKLQNGVCWVNTNKLPQYIEFDYIYPNGKSGDILKYIFEEYGETSIKAGTVWTGRIDKQYVNLFEVFYSSIPLNISDDIRYGEIFKYHIPTIITEKLTELVYKKANYFDSFREYQALTIANSKEQTRKRTEIYSQLILQGQTSPKWKSEAQLYALVSNTYQDAVYQYRCEWLRMQSLDIFIPSLSIGIEYQGRQHYEPIEHFGGEEHFKHQQENDAKKKALCKTHGITLIEWSYTEDITEANLIKHLSKAQNKREKKTTNK